MLTVVIKINCKTICARSACNMDKKRGNKVRYDVDDGRTIWHDPEAGAIPLAIELLRGIKELHGVKKK